MSGQSHIPDVSYRPIAQSSLGLKEKVNLRNVLPDTPLSSVHTWSVGGGGGGRGGEGRGGT